MGPGPGHRRAAVRERRDAGGARLRPGAGADGQAAVAERRAAARAGAGVDSVDAAAIADAWNAAVARRRAFGQVAGVVLLFLHQLASQADLQGRDARRAAPERPTAPTRSRSLVMRLGRLEGRLPPNCSAAVRKLAEKLSAMNRTGGRNRHGTVDTECRRTLRYGPDRNPRPVEDLQDGRRRDSRARGRVDRDRARRIRRHHGAVGLGQVHADEPDRLPRHAEQGHLPPERQGSQPDERQRAGAHPQRGDRVRVPDLQPAAARHGAAQRRAAAGLRRHAEEGAARAGEGGDREGRARRIA